MAPDLTTPDPLSVASSESDPEQVIKNVADCPNCGNRAILFSHTIQTFCYHCGMAVTRLDATGLYYVLVAPSPLKKAADA